MKKRNKKILYSFLINFYTPVEDRKSNHNTFLVSINETSYKQNVYISNITLIIIYIMWPYTQVKKVKTKLSM